MAARKPPVKSAAKSSKTTRAKPKKPFHTTQVDDPIIIKPGGSLVIEMDKNFRDAHTPSKPNKKGHKHPDATRITEVAILNKNGTAVKRFTVTDKDAQVQICYLNPANGCDCP